MIVERAFLRGVFLSGRLGEGDTEALLAAMASTPPENLPASTLHMENVERIEEGGVGTLRAAAERYGHLYLLVRPGSQVQEVLSRTDLGNDLEVLEFDR